MTSKATRNAISSPGSASGLMGSGSPDGPTSALSGQVLVPASLSARRAKELGFLTSGTYGPRNSISSASAALSSGLASRLQVRTASLGSTLFKLTWKERATPSGRLIPALRASVLRTSGSGSELPRKGWTTPQAHDTSGRSQTQKELHGTKHGCACLVREARMAGWPTPNTPSGGRSVSIEKMDATGRTADGKKHTASLEHAVKFAGWPTPTVMDASRGAKDSRPWDTGRPLNQIAALSGGADADDARSQGRIGGRDGTGKCAARALGVELQEQPGPVNGFWRDADWLYCRDDKWRPVEPGAFPLVDGAPARVGCLRGYGNAVDAIATKEFIEVVQEVLM